MVDTANITQFMIDSWKGNGKGLRGLEESAKEVNLELREESTAEVLTTMDQGVKYLQEQANTSGDDVDLDRLYHETMPNSLWEALKWEGDSKQTAQEIYEATVADVRASQWLKFHDRVIRTVFSSIMCPAAGFGLQDTMSRIDIPCSSLQDKSQECEIITPRYKIQYDMEHETGDVPTMWVGIGQRRCWTYTIPGVSRVGFGLHRSLQCINANEAVRNHLDQSIRKNLAWDDELMRARLWFGMDGTDGNPKYLFEFDGNRYQSGYQFAAGGVWQNVITGPEYEMKPCNYPVLSAIEQLYEDAVDPHTGEPVTCDGDFNLIMTRKVKIEGYRTLIQGGSHRNFSDDSNGCNTEFLRGLTGREGWSSTVAYSRYVWEPLVQWYMNNTFQYLDAAGNPQTSAVASDRKTAENWAANTYVVSKSLQDSATWMVDFDVTTHELRGTNHQIFLDRGVTFQRMYEYKRIPGWKRPWMTILVRAFNPAVNPIV